MTPEHATRAPVPVFPLRAAFAPPRPAARPAAERNQRCRGGFTLVELLVVMAIIALLMAVLLPGLSLARQHAGEAVCRSNLRQMTMLLKTYCNDHDSLFPDSTYLYHSRKSLDPNKPVLYPMGCRWHDARIGPASPLLTGRRDLQGSLIPYLGNPKIVICKTGARANRERGCSNLSPVVTSFRKEVSEHRRETEFLVTAIPHDEDIPIIPQYTYTMNGNLCRTFQTAGVIGGTVAVGADEYKVVPQTLRQWEVRKETQVTRSPAEVFAFGEENSWAINGSMEGGSVCNLSGPWPGPMDHDHGGRHDFTDSILAAHEFTGKITLGGLDIGPSYSFVTKEDGLYAKKVPDAAAGDAFATCHRPRGGDLNTGHSYVSLLDGHVQKVTVADQLRRSRQVEDLPASRLGPGGNLHLAWPLDTPPLAGWENQ